MSFRERYEEIKKTLKSLPVHSAERIQSTADQLRMLHFRFVMGSLDIDIFEMTASELLEVFEKIAALSFEELRRTPHFEKPYPDEDQNAERREQWADDARLQRIQFLMKKYMFLLRLRDDEPEAWDAVNELVFDD
jgi:hypothetical protein